MSITFHNKEVVCVQKTVRQSPERFPAYSIVPDGCINLPCVVVAFKEKMDHCRHRRIYRHVEFYASVGQAQRTLTPSKWEYLLILKRIGDEYEVVEEHGDPHYQIRWETEGSHPKYKRS